MSDKNWNLGVGHDYKPNYIGFDIRETPATDIICDVTKDLPEEDKGTVDNIIAFEILEHIRASRWRDVLEYWISFLKDGGKIHLRVPDLEEVIRQADRMSVSEFNRYIYGAQENDLDYHKCGFTERILVDTLEEMGMEVETVQHVLQTRLIYVDAKK